MKRWTMTNDIYSKWRDSVKNQEKNRMVRSMIEIIEKDKDNAYR